MKRLKLVFLLLVVLSVFGSSSHAQNLIDSPPCGDGQLEDEGVCRDIRQVAADDGGSVYWVDGTGGSDTNPGTESEPFATISRTTREGFLQPGDWVIIRQGIYREEIRPQESGVTSGGDTLRITWAAYPGDDVVVSGADVVTTSWQKQSDGTWRQDWVWDGIWNDPGREGLHRRELFVDDGRPLVPVSSRSEVVPGTFYVDGGSEDNTPSAIYIRTHDDTDPNEHNIEVGQRGQLFQTGGEPDHECGSSGRYYHLIGLVFRHATTHSQRGAVCPGARGSLLERVTARENNGAGFKVVGSQHTLRNVRALNNGRTGLSGSRAENILVDGAEIANNNYRGHDYFNESGGGKFTETTGSTFRRLYSHDNNGPGFWLDIRNVNNTIERSVFDRNIGFGLNLELKTRGTRVVNNVFSRTRFEARPHRGFGLSVQLSYDNLIAFNTFIMNGEGGVYTWNDGREDNPDYAPTRSQENDVFNNLFINNLQDPSPEENQMQLVDLRDGEEVHTGFTNQVNGNAYWPSNAGKGFGALYHVKDPRGGTGNFRAESLAEWQRVTVHDQNSFTVDASEPHVVNPNDAESGWRLASGSQMVGRSVSLPDGRNPVTTDFYGNPRPVEGADIGAHQRSTDFLAEQEISLRQGWNLISSSVEPHKPSLSEVFAGILSHVSVVEDERGDRFVPDDGINTIGDWSTHEAYRVYVDQAQKLRIQGRRVDPAEEAISLQEGWNLVPFLPQDPMSVIDAFASVSTELVIVKDGAADAYIPSYDIDELETGEPGQGYAIYLTTPATLTYPSSTQTSLMSTN